jgi:hypothetical protein
MLAKLQGGIIDVGRAFETPDFRSFAGDFE